MNNHITIAIDGPASSGKSTVAKLVAHEKGYIYIDTGAMYRALTYKALKTDIDINDEESLYALLMDTTISFSKEDNEQFTLVDNEYVSNVIRQNDVTNNVSVVSSHRDIRAEMVTRQQKLADNASVVMDGRDIGTVVLPKATLKIFLKATAHERAMRRFLENQEKGINTDFETLLAEINRRDEIDSTRKESPLRKAEDAIVIDTTSLSIDEVKNKILDLLDKKIKI